MNKDIKKIYNHVLELNHKICITDKFVNCLDRHSIVIQTRGIDVKARQVYVLSEEP